jgi:hypothetical protein
LIDFNTFTFEKNTFRDNVRSNFTFISPINNNTLIIQCLNKEYDPGVFGQVKYLGKEYESEMKLKNSTTTNGLLKPINNKKTFKITIMGDSNAHVLCNKYTSSDVLNETLKLIDITTKLSSLSTRKIVLYGLDQFILLGHTPLLQMHCILNNQNYGTLLFNCNRVKGKEVGFR